MGIVKGISFWKGKSATPSAEPSILTHPTLPDNLVSYYKCDADGSFQDEHGTNHGTINGATYNTNGIIDGCYDLESSSTNYIDVGEIYTANRTIQAWVYLESDDTQHIMGDIGSTTSARGMYVLLRNAGTGDIKFQVQAYTGSSDFAWTRSDIGDIQVNTWYHIVATYDGSGTSGLKLYINGVLQAGTSGNGGTFTGDLQDSGANQKYGVQNVSNIPMDGLLDECAIWSRALISDEVSDLYNSGNALQYNTNTVDESILGTAGLSDNLVSYYSADADGSFPDLHGTNDGVVNGATYTENGLISGAYDYDGSDDYTTLSNASTFKFTNDFTYAFWFKTTQTAVRYVSSCTFDPNPGSFTGYGCYMNAGQIYIRKLTGASTTVDVSSTETGLNDGNWHYLVAVHDSTNGVLLYIDGALSNSDSDVNNVYYDATTAYFDFARRNNDGTGELYWDGILDETGIWSRALSSTEVSKLYNSGAGLPYRKPTRSTVTNHATLTDGLVSYYSCDADGSFPDSHGTNDGTINGATYTSDGKITGCYNYDGTDDYINLDYSSVGTISACTINCWVYLNNTNSTSNLIFNQGSSSSSNRFNIHLYNGGTTYWDFGNTSSARISKTYDGGTGSWVMWTFTADTTGLKIYKNGTLWHSGGTGSTVDLSLYDLQIANYTNIAYLDGKIDEYGFWNRELTSAEVTSLYNEGIGLPYK